MTKGIGWVVAAVVLVWMLLRPRAKGGAAAGATSPPAESGPRGPAQLVGTIIDGVAGLVRSGSEVPTGVIEQGDIGLFPG